MADRPPLRPTFNLNANLRSLINTNREELTATFDKKKKKGNIINMQLVSLWDK